MKNIGNKFKGKENKIRIFCALGEIMHSCHDDESVQHVVTKLFNDFKEEKKNLQYFKTNWLSNNKIRKFFIVSFHDSSME